MYYYLVFIAAFLLTSCGVVFGPTDFHYPKGPVSYIEWEAAKPRDTTFWTFDGRGTVFAAWKRKITNDQNIPVNEWQPLGDVFIPRLRCDSTITNFDPVPIGYTACDTIYDTIFGTDIIGRTRCQFLRDSIEIADGFLPIEYAVGTYVIIDSSMVWRLNTNVLPNIRDPYQFTTVYGALWVISLVINKWTSDTMDCTPTDGLRQLVRFSKWDEHLFSSDHHVYQGSWLHWCDSTGRQP